ncbi:hypothetical protein [Enterovirga sp. CN4-39]|uniref:hypothetical protein n=1 Tax=Enterovirga sp. CN4-39 TaxID=3400910 RepID=UPI003C0D77EA
MLVISSSSTVTAVLVVIVDALVRLSLALGLGGAAGTVAAAIGAAAAIMPLVRAAAVASGLATLVSLRTRALHVVVRGQVALLFLASIFVVSRNHRRISRSAPLSGAHLGS